MGYAEKIMELRQRRKKRVRLKLKEVNRRGLWRIYFHVSNRYLYAQLIDDTTGRTLATLSTSVPPLKTGETVKNKEAARKLAEQFAQLLKQKNLWRPEGYVFDRGNRLYHGRVKTFVDTLREHGVKI
ncbi:MAG: 50S ribosomal protein L18 [Leptospiraceae bacterium]|nr:50S ribosomal protein L18 [Leptospiraceae bacterium]MDW8306066.1 50S ribosomal protein L18 [Leptospiraceae bacterium]